jgi:hypothetical protein
MRRPPPAGIACLALILLLVVVLGGWTAHTFRHHRHGWAATAIGAATVVGTLLLAGALVGTAIVVRRRNRPAAWGAVVAAGFALLGTLETQLLGAYPLTSNEGRVCYVALQAESREPVDEGGRAVLRRAAALPSVRSELRDAAKQLAQGVTSDRIEARLLRTCLH